LAIAFCLDILSASFAGKSIFPKRHVPDLLHSKSIKVFGSAYQETHSEIAGTFLEKHHDLIVEYKKDARHPAIYFKNSKLFHHISIHSTAY
jgi:hypothetical protein